MKIAYKLPLVQLFLTLFFFVALAIIIFFFVHISDILNIKAQVSQLHQQSIFLQKDQNLMPFKNVSYLHHYRQLNDTQENIAELFKKTENELNDFDYSQSEIEHFFDLIYQDWKLVSQNYIAPQLELLTEIRDFPSSSLVDQGGIPNSPALMSPQEWAKVEELIAISEQLSQNILEEELISPLGDLDVFIEVFANDLLLKMRRLSFLISLFTFVVGAIIGVILASRISRNLVLLDNSIEQVASGNLHFTIETQGNDEFKQIGSYFNNLTDTLWFRLDSLKDIMRDLGSSIEDDTSETMLLETVLELAIDSTGGESGIVLLYNEDSNDLSIGAQMGNFPPPLKVPSSVLGNDTRLKEWFEKYRFKMGETLIGEAAEKRTSFFIKDNYAQKLYPNNTNKDSQLFISSSLILPLTNQSELLGLLVLSKNTADELFTELDFTFMKSYSRFVTIQLDNFRKYQALVQKHEINREIGVAAEIQKTLLPGRLPRMKSLQIGAYSDAAKGVSGDYYDVFPLSKNKIAIIICDVSGKGIPASLFMVMIRTVIRTISSPGMNAAEILQSVNQEITGNFRTGTFATISLLIVDQRDYHISYANGAHHPLYLYRARTGKYLKFDADGLPLGIDIHASFGHKRIRIEPNDYLLLFTDGITEARNPKGEELSTNRLLQQALKYMDKGAPQMKDSVRSYLKRFCGTAKQHDDETFVAVKIV